MELGGYWVASAGVELVKPTLDGVALRDDQEFNLARLTSYTKGSQQCGPFSFGFLECGCHCGGSIGTLNVVDWVGIADAG